MDDPRQQPADLDQLLVEDRDNRHLAKLNEAAHPGEQDFRGRILGHVVVGPRLQARQNVGIVIANRQH